MEGIKEKNIKAGNISTFHVWWARRPLSTSRATNYAALVPFSQKDVNVETRKNFIINLAKWENTTNTEILSQAREDILHNFHGTAPKILDPFGGGGSIPLEAMKLGCHTYSNDLNPVAILIQKCLLEYPQKYGLISSKQSRSLIADIDFWQHWVLDRARQDLNAYFPHKSDGSEPIGYFWVHTIACQNPVCGRDIPLLRQFWLVKREQKKIFFMPKVTKTQIQLEIKGDGDSLTMFGFNPAMGTIQKGTVTCPACGHSIKARITRQLFCEGRSMQKMIALVLIRPGVKGKIYLPVSKKDLQVYAKAEENLADRRKSFEHQHHFDPIPNEETPRGGGRGAERAFSQQNYGLNYWSQAFNARQQLVLISFLETILAAHKQMLADGYKVDYAKAITTYLALGYDRLAAFCNILCRWKSSSESVVNLFSRQCLAMIWDYVEINPIGKSPGNWESCWKYYFRVIQDALRTTATPCSLTCASATQLPYPANFFDGVFTDPPYYDNVPYSHLSDFFYVFLRRCVGKIHPELFHSVLTPKDQEIVAYSHRTGGMAAGKQFYENMLKQSFREIYRVLKPKGIAIVLFAHKTLAGWETFFNSLQESGLTVVTAWPIATEMDTRLRTHESATLANSLYVVVRKLSVEKEIFSDVLTRELHDHLQNKLNILWDEGIRGGDLVTGAFGAGIELLGQYKRVFDFSAPATTIPSSSFLSYIWQYAVNYTSYQIDRRT